MVCLKLHTFLSIIVCANNINCGVRVFSVTSIMCASSHYVMCNYHVLIPCRVLLPLCVLLLLRVVLP